MTPQEKAQELVSKFKEVEIYLSIEPTDIDLKIKYITSSSYTAKQCALIAVEEIINANGLHPNDTDYDYNKAEVYWEQVKTEIEKL
jgi:hypothetical protein